MADFEGQILLLVWCAFPILLVFVLVFGTGQWRSFVRSELVTPVQQAIRSRIDMDDKAYSGMSEIERHSTDKRRARSSLIATTGGGVLVTILVAALNPIAGVLVGIRTFKAIKNASEDYDAIALTSEEKSRRTLHS